MAEFEARHFFESMLPAFLTQAAGAPTTALVQIDLVEGTLCSSYLFHVSEGRPTVSPVAMDDPDLRITIDHHLVLPLLLGELEPEPWLDAGLLALEGEPEAWTGWGELLTRPDASLQAWCRALLEGARE